MGACPLEGTIIHATVGSINKRPSAGREECAIAKGCLCRRFGGEVNCKRLLVVCAANGKVAGVPACMRGAATGALRGVVFAVCSICMGRTTMACANSSLNS